ncbi:MAG: hypothetical protein D8H97_00815 [Neisseria sp.]|nr:MAG: hypothetical protein D8H97_00815 [Neisseria sp.]
MPKPKPAKRFKKDGLRVFVYAQNKSLGGLGSKSTKVKNWKKEMPNRQIILKIEYHHSRDRLNK